MATSTGMRQAIKRVRLAWSEIDYAQRRLFEIRTGVPVTRPRRSVGSLEELEASYPAESHAARP